MLPRSTDSRYGSPGYNEDRRRPARDAIMPSVKSRCCSGRVFDFLELALVEGLKIGLLAGDHCAVHEVLEGPVHRAHTHSTARLHDIFELLELALANEVGDGRRVDEDLKRRHAP